MTSERRALDEQFAGDTLDPDVWLPYHLPHWSSRAQSAATYSVSDGELHLSIPPDQPLWCADLHDEPVRISCIQSGCLNGQQPFRPGLGIQEEQPEFRGYTPLYGNIEVRMRGTVTARSMFAFYLSGIEDQPDHSGEICVAEIFGSDVGPSGAHVGIGVKKLRDPMLAQEFSADPLPIDVSEFHTYGVDWRPGALAFRVDGEVVRRVAQAPDYPVQLMLGVFDFPEQAQPDDIATPELVVSHVRGQPLS
ncbi:glycoside hydrolase family 16 protein [Flindersiella endophytica]